MNKKKLKFNRAILFIFIPVLILTLGKIVVSNILATTGNRLGEIEARSVSLKTENQALQKELSELSSLNRIASEAGKLGFTKANFVVYLKEEIPVALR